MWGKDFAHEKIHIYPSAHKLDFADVAIGSWNFPDTSSGHGEKQRDRFSDAIDNTFHIIQWQTQ